MRVVKWIALLLGGLLGLALLLVVADLGWESVDPFTLPRIVISNGAKTVTFEAMVHIGSARFYDGVRDDIRREKQAGASYFYEGVRVGRDPAAVVKILQLATHGAAEDVNLMKLYALLGEATGLEVQPQLSFLGLVNDHDRNVDITADALLARMQAEPVSDTPASKQHFTGADLDRRAAELARLGPAERRVLAWVLRHQVSTVLRLMGDRAARMLDTRDLLDTRNRMLADAVLGGPDRVIITYGALHFPGLLADLQQADPRWHVVGRAPREVFE